MTLPNPSPSDIIRKALEAFVYETTHLSPQEDNGSHWAQISAHTLNYGREALAALALMEAENARLTATLDHAERGWADCRQSLTEQAAARADPAMPRLTLDVLERLEGDAEANYACAEDRDDRVAAHGLSLLCEWQRKAIAQPGDANG